MGMPGSLPLNIDELRPGMQFLKYELLEQIGAGGQGVVWSALEKEISRIVAIKFLEAIDKQAQAVSDNVFDQQGELFKRLEHPNILPLYDFGSLEGLRYLVSLYIPGGSLQDKLAAGQLPVETALDFAAHIASALDYLHAHDIIHRDLKPGNVLMDYSRNIYVFDFGLARVLSSSTMAMHTGHGTLPYSPPEQSSHSEITVQSDLYSFGVVLYQLFTGHLPWDGEIALGIQQLHTSDEIPDPREYNAGLPPALVKTLRTITAAQPSSRPRSASAVMQMLYDDFNIPPLPVDISRKNDISPTGLGANEIIQDAMQAWDISRPEVPLTLTKFALVDVAEKQSGGTGGPGNLASFMLHCALVYAYDIDFWWKKVADPPERLRIAAAFIRRDNLALTSRALGLLLHDHAILHSNADLPDGLTDSLLEVAGSRVSQDLKLAIFDFLESMVHPQPHWQTSFPDIKQAQALAALACEETVTGDRAARLIGRLHSTEAVTRLLATVKEDRRDRALLGVLAAAGSLPAFLPRSTRLALSLESLTNWLASNLAALLGVFGLAALGVFLGFGAQVYLTYQLPNYMDITRISIAVERGLFMGLVFGAGIFITRLLSETLPFSKTLLRMALAALVGGVVLTAGLLLYDLLFLNTLPGGVLFAAGCFFISAGYAVSQWVRPVAAKMIIAIMVLFLALAGSWFGHIAVAGSPTGMTPIFFYDYAWPISQILGTMLVAALPMGIFGSLGKIPHR